MWVNKNYSVQKSVLTNRNHSLCWRYQSQTVYLFNNYQRQRALIEQPLQWLQQWGLLHGSKRGERAWIHLPMLHIQCRGFVYRTIKYLVKFVLSVLLPVMNNVDIYTHFQFIISVLEGSFSSVLVVLVLCTMYKWQPDSSLVTSVLTL